MDSSSDLTSACALHILPPAPERRMSCQPSWSPGHMESTGSPLPSPRFSPKSLKQVLASSSPSPSEHKRRPGTAVHDVGGQSRLELWSAPSDLILADSKSLTGVQLGGNPRAVGHMRQCQEVRAHLRLDAILKDRVGEALSGAQNPESSIHNPVLMDED